MMAYVLLPGKAEKGGVFTQRRKGRQGGELTTKSTKADENRKIYMDEQDRQDEENFPMGGADAYIQPHPLRLAGTPSLPHLFHLFDHNSRAGNIKQNRFFLLTCCDHPPDSHLQRI
jgi:hypothetical protein